MPPALAASRAANPAYAFILNKARTSPLAVDVFAFCGLFLFAFIIRAQTFDNPFFGYDEQFYALVGRHMLHGALPYVDIFDRKPIGLFLIYAGAAALGGENFAAYKLVALIVVAITAFALYKIIKRETANVFAAVCASVLYLIALNFMEGAGGQAEIFYNLPMLLAGILVWRAAQQPSQIIPCGLGAMCLVGLSIQIKYTVIFEGLFFGLTLLCLHWQNRRNVVALGSFALLCLICALGPTLLATAYYWHVNALNAFVFANFYSIFGRNPCSFADQFYGFCEILVFLSPVLILVILGQTRAKKIWHFPIIWLISSIVGVIIFGSFGTPHYGLPVLVPACLAAAEFFKTQKARKTMVLALAVGATLSQVTLARVAVLHGNSSDATTMAQALKSHKGCIFIYSGEPALYDLDHSCLPTHWPFPSHLNSRSEDSVRALGINPEQEVQRILAAHPEYVVDDEPGYPDQNVSTHKIVLETLHRDYHVVLDLKTASADHHMIFMKNAQGWKQPALGYMAAK